MEKLITGNYAVAYGVMRARAEVVAAYPITPQTQIVELLSKFCANGELDAKFIRVESEHSAMASCIGASATGVRAFTATSAHGLALMHEMLHWAAGGRFPVVLTNVNRAMGSPWSVWTDQNDSLAQRDTGWLQFYCESNQEALDTVIQAFKISESIKLPSMQVLDAFVLSHTSEPVNIPEQEKVDEFLPEYSPSVKLDINEPRAFGALADPDNYFELRYKIQRTMQEAKSVIKQVDKEFEEQFGRSYGLVEGYHLNNSDLVLVTSGTVTSTARHVVNKMRARGHKVGLLKIKTFRPFPAREVRDYLGNAKKIAVVDRNISFGQGGIFFQEVKSCLYGDGGSKPSIFGFVAGLGGRDVTPKTLRDIIDYARRAKRQEEDVIWMGLKR